MPEIQDKEGNPIQKGDHVWSKSRGGRHEGDAEKIVTTEKGAQKEDVKHPPKVVFTDQHGHKVSHNPESLTNESAKQS